MSKVYLIDSNGEVTEYYYSLPPLEAIKACVIQEVKGIRNFVGKDIDIEISETEHSYIYPFGDNKAVFTRKNQ